MKMQIILIAVFFTLLAISSPVSAVVPDLQIDEVYNQADSSETPYTSSLSTVSKSVFSLTDSSRIGPVSGDVAEYVIKVNVGPGEYDNITLTNYVEEKSPWHTKTDRNLVILPGQGLTAKFYTDMAIYYAQRGYSVYILDRRETNIPADEDDFSFMEDWTVEEHLNDTYKGINASRSHTALLSGKSAESIKVTAIGHSHGALLLTAYEASKYDDLPLGSVSKIVPVDIVIKYDPEYSELIYNQTQEFTDVSSDIGDGIFYGTGMAKMMYVAGLASVYPDEVSPIQPEPTSKLTNIQLFRLMASQTYNLSLYPYTPDYHYWSGDLNGLYYVNESQLLSITLTGGAVPFTPKYMDQYMAGLMGNVDGYEIDSSKIDSPVLYVGLGGGFGYYGSWWYENEVGKTNSRVTSMNWNNQGHASLLIDHNSPELWALIYNWMKDTKV
jgi:uncharacterized protein with FMN-binding domain